MRIAGRLVAVACLASVAHFVTRYAILSGPNTEVGPGVSVSEHNDLCQLAGVKNIAQVEVLSWGATRTQSFSSTPSLEGADVRVRVLASIKGSWSTYDEVFLPYGVTSKSRTLAGPINAGDKAFIFAAEFDSRKVVVFQGLFLNRATGFSNGFGYHDVPVDRLASAASRADATCARGWFHPVEKDADPPLSVIGPRVSWPPPGVRILDAGLEDDAPVRVPAGSGVGDGGL